MQNTTKRPWLGQISLDGIPTSDLRAEITRRDNTWAAERQAERMRKRQEARAELIARVKARHPHDLLLQSDAGWADYSYDIYELWRDFEETWG